MQEQILLIPPAVTVIQQRYLDWIKKFIAKNQYSPSLKEVATAFGVTPHAVHCQVRALVKKGALNKAPGVARSLSIPKHLND